MRVRDALAPYERPCRFAASIHLRSAFFTGTPARKLRISPKMLRVSRGLRSSAKSSHIIAS